MVSSTRKPDDGSDPLADHPMSYGWQKTPLGEVVVYNPAPDDELVRERMARCPTCEQWSPCDVRMMEEAR